MDSGHTFWVGEEMVCTSPCILSRVAWCHFVLFLVMLAWTAWLKAYLPDFSAVQVLFSPFFWYLVRVEGLCWGCVNILLRLAYADFHIHLQVFLEFIITMVDKWWFTDYIPSVFISCKKKKSVFSLLFFLPVCLHLSFCLFQYGLMESYNLCSHWPVWARRTSF